MDSVFLANVSQTKPVLSGYQFGHVRPASSSGGATVPGPYFYEMVTQELRNTVLAGGITPDAGDLTQVSQAIVLLATKAGQSASATFAAAIETATSNAAAAIAIANTARTVAYALPTALANTADNTQGGALVAAPYGLPYTAQGTVGNRLMGQAYTPEESGAIGNTPSHDDGPALQAAIDYCLAHGINQLRSTRNFYTAQPLYISNFTFAFELHLGSLNAHANFPAIPTAIDAFGQTFSDWKNAQSLIVGGAVGGSIVGVKIYIGYLNGGRKAYGFFNTNNGMGGCEFHFTRAENCVRVVGHDSNTSPTASNRYFGRYWQNNLQAASLEGGASVNEGTQFDVGFITNNIYGGIVVGNKGQYFDASRSQLDFNGQWVTLFQVSTLAGFTVGQRLSNASGGYGELLAAFVDAGANYFAVIETKNTTGGMTNFAVGNNFTNGVNVTSILGISTTDQGGNKRFFDIILASDPSTPFSRFTAMCPYLGGVIGNQVWNGTVISGHSVNGSTNWFNGMGVDNGGPGGNLSLYNRADNLGSNPFLTVNRTTGILAPGLRLYSGNLQDLGIENEQSIASGATVAMATFVNNASDGSGGASAHGAMWEFALHDQETSAIFASGKVRCNLAGSASFLTFDSIVLPGSTTPVIAQIGCTVTLSGLTLSVSQASGSTRSIYLVYKRKV